MDAKQIPGIQIENIGTRRKPLPVLKGFIQLPCWTDFFLAEKPNYLFTSGKVTDGRIDLWVDGEIHSDGSFSIDEEQNNAYFFLIENQEKVKHVILQKLRKDFPRLLRTEYSCWDYENGGFPKQDELTADFDFKNYIGPSSISIVEDIKEETSYTKWNFQCLWDPEHGFEVITHKDRVIDLSPDADIFKINKDNGTYEALEKELENKVWKKPLKKKWWQFW